MAVATMNNKIWLSVITPTYNRAHTIDRVYNSLAAQSFRSFEWVVIDDGSTDNTKELISHYSQISFFPIRYYYKPNGGKHRAVNFGFKQSHGEFILVFDSDDWCFSYAFERLFELWHSLPDREKMNYSGVSVLMAHTNGEIIGDLYPPSSNLKTYVDRYNHRIRGDKWELIRRDLYVKYSYPEIDGERYIAPSYSWLQIGKQYKTLFSNDVLSCGDYLNDGISKNNILYRASNPKGCCKVYALQFHMSKIFLLKLKSATNYYRFFWRGGALKMLGTFTLPCIILGYLLFIYDSYCLKRKSLLRSALFFEFDNILKRKKKD
jgi:glycosyltransferase involved in cell wall biosynthesis